MAPDCMWELSQLPSVGSIKGVKDPGGHHSTLHFFKLSSLFLSNAEALARMGYSVALLRAYWQEYRDGGKSVPTLKETVYKALLWLNIVSTIVGEGEVLINATTEFLDSFTPWKETIRLNKCKS